MKKTNKLSTKMIVLLGLLTAAEIVLNRFCSFNTWNMKIGVSFIPVALAAMLWGPVCGGIVAALGDFLGAVLFPIGAYFPGFTATAFLTGCVYGLFLYRKQTLPRVLGAIAVNGVFGTLLLNTLWISIAYGAPFGPTLVSRLVQAGVVAVFQCFILSAMIRVLPRIRPYAVVSRQEQRLSQRRAGIAARNGLDPSARSLADAAIVKAVVETEAWKNAKLIMSYAAVRSEVNLQGLTKIAEEQGKILVYPVCISSSEMAACRPDSWRLGMYKIPEPDPARSRTVDPSEIDLVLCPCSTFDDNCNRMGMGAGYYDRYLQTCTRATFAAIAYEVQRQHRILTEVWDRPMDMVVTEKGVTYRKKKSE